MANKKVFTDESLGTFVDEIKSYTDNAISTKADSDHTHNYLPLSGGRLTGNLTGQYLTGTWLQTTATTDLGRVPDRYPVLDGSGWLYNRSATQTKGDLGITDIENSIKNINTTLDSKVPTSRTINGKALSDDITLSVSDVGADASGSAENALTTATAYTDAKFSELETDISSLEYQDLGVTTSENIPKVEGCYKWIDANNVVPVAGAPSTDTVGLPVLTEIVYISGNSAYCRKDVVYSPVGNIVGIRYLMAIETDDSWREMDIANTIEMENVIGLSSALTNKANTNHSHNDATQSASGFMSNTDKTKLDGIETGANKTTVDSSLSATSTNPVQNKVVNNELNRLQNDIYENNQSWKDECQRIDDVKVDKEDGKGLSTNDYTTAEKNKLAGVAEGANNYTLPIATDTVLGGVKVDTAITAGSTNPVQNGAVFSALFSKASSSHSHSVATTSVAGFMSVEDKAYVNNLKLGVRVDTSLSGYESVALGSSSTVGGVDCISMSGGQNTGGYYTTSCGQGTTTGWNTFANGVGCSAQGHGQVVFGKYPVAYDGAMGDTDTTGAIFIVGVGSGTATTKNALRITNAGKCMGASTFTGSGADYAEYYEWLDGNPGNEDRRGYFVTLEGTKIRKASAEDDYILGVISATPFVVGNGYTDEWRGMFLKDIFGENLTETVEVPETTDEATGAVIPAHTETRFIVNPEYDHTQKYIGRDERKEWATVGTHGQLVVVDDGTCEVNHYCKVAANGTATKADGKTEYRVTERLDETHIRIVIK